MTFFPRLKRHEHDISSVCGQLNWRGTSPFGELSGAFPFTSSSDLENRVVNFSSDFPIKSSSQYSLWDVTRGFSSKQKEAYDIWSSQSRSWNTSYYAKSSIHVSAYPLPTSFPALGGYRSESQTHGSQSTKTRFRSAEVFSSLSTSNNVAMSFKEYALFIENCVKRRTTITASIDISVDDLKELANDLWTIHDNSSEENGDYSM